MTRQVETTVGRKNRVASGVWEMTANRKICTRREKKASASRDKLAPPGVEEDEIKIVRCTCRSCCHGRAPWGRCGGIDHYSLLLLIMPATSHFDVISDAACAVNRDGRRGQ